MRKKYIAFEQGLFEKEMIELEEYVKKWTELIVGVRNENPEFSSPKKGGLKDGGTGVSDTKVLVEAFAIKKEYYWWSNKIKDYIKKGEYGRAEKMLSVIFKDSTWSKSGVAFGIAEKSENKDCKLQKKEQNKIVELQDLQDIYEDRQLICFTLYSRYGDKQIVSQKCLLKNYLEKKKYQEFIEEIQSMTKRKVSIEKCLDKIDEKSIYEYVKWVQEKKNKSDLDVNPAFYLLRELVNRLKNVVVKIKQDGSKESSKLKERIESIGNKMYDLYLKTNLQVPIKK
ncbi:hypothetical protein ACFLZV_06710, partial [Candidatus Margulisiibacteriota bacterium]